MLAFRVINSVDFMEQMIGYYEKTNSCYATIAIWKNARIVEQIILLKKLVNFSEEKELSFVF